MSPRLPRFQSVVLFLSLLLLAKGGYCEGKVNVAKQYNFKEYTVFDGLPQGQVTAVQQDPRGYIWTGSYAGITRYNGKVFTTITEGLPSNVVSAMQRDRKGRIYFGTRAGLCVLELNALSCEEKGESLPFPNIFDIEVTRDDQIWLAAEGGVIRLLNGKTTTFSINEGLPSPTVRSILVDRNGQVWAGTTKGLALLEENRFQLVHPAIFKLTSVRAAISTVEGNYFGTNRGLFLRNADGEVDQIDQKLEQPLDVLSLFKDTRGILWIGTVDGLYRLINGEFEKLSPQKGLKSVSTYDITEDKEGNIWIGYDAGLVKYVPGPFVTYTTKQGMSHDFVRSMSVDSEGKVWMGTRHGISIFDPQTDTFEKLTEQLQTDQLRVYSVLNLQDGTVLIGTRDGLIEWKDGRVVSRKKSTDGLPASYVPSLYQDQSGTVWIGTARGIAQWKDGTILPVKQHEALNAGTFSIQEDSQQRLWLGTGNQGVVVFDPKTEQYQTLDHIAELSKYTVWSIDTDAANRFWIGTNGHGLLSVNEDFELLNVYDRNSGLGDNFVWQVLVDQQQRIWAFTNRGLKRFHEGHFTHFDGAHGLPDLEGAASATLEHPNGDLWFGTGFGVTRFVASEERDDQTAPPIIIEGAWLGEKALNDFAKVKFDSQAIKIKFASLSFRNEQDIEFIYRLLDLNEKWSSPQEISQIQLMNLSPGDYRLEVKAVRAQRIKSSVPASFNFTVLTPFWLSWWFILAAIILTISLFFLFIQYRTRKLAIEKTRLAALVADRTSELRKINEELNRLVATDELTGLYNRRYLMESLNKELMRLPRSPIASYLSFILIDADYFKDINDTHGHSEGDLVLKLLSQRIESCSRRTDIVARYGGEEFAMVLPFTDLAGALICAEKMKLAVSDEPFQLSHGEEISMTISIGIVTYENQSLSATDNLSDLMIRQADAALYRAKNQGRNRICVFDPEIDIGQ